MFRAQVDEELLVYPINSPCREGETQSNCVVNGEMRQRLEFRSERVVGQRKISKRMILGLLSLEINLPLPRSSCSF